MNSICGLDCSECELNEACGGCIQTNGRPFRSECVVAACCQKSGYEHCSECSDTPCNLRKQLITEFNALGIEDMEEVTGLHCLKGSFVNLEYTLQSGQVIKLWDDNRIYLGNQICKKNSDRCYGLTADENYLLVTEYGAGGSDAEIVVYKRRSTND